MKKNKFSARYDVLKTFEENCEKGPYEKVKDNNSLIKKTLGEYGIEADFFGFKTSLPIGVAAGTLPTPKYLEASMKDGFEVLTWKTFRSLSRLAHRNDGKYLGHNIVFLPSETIKKEDVEGKRIATLIPKENPGEISITNSVGMPSPSPIEWMNYIAKGNALAKKYGKFVLTSVVGTAREGDDISALSRDYAFAARCAESAGSDIIELNLSCPNVSGKEGMVYKCVEDAFVVVKTVAEFLYKPETKLLIKIGYGDAEHYTSLLKQCAPYIDGVVSINTIPMQVVDEKGNQALPGGTRSGTCGSAILELSVEAVKSLRVARDSLGSEGKHIKVIGCGGVMNAEGFMKHIDAGSEFVFCSTASIFNPDLPMQIAEYLAKEKIKRSVI